MTITASAPNRRSARAASTVAETGSPKFSVRTLALTVTFGVSGVESPMMPMRAPATSTIVYGLAHAGVAPVAFSVTLAARNGNLAMAAFFFSAPTGSSSGRAMVVGPTGP